MALYIDKKFISMISHHLPLFKWQGTNNDVANARCCLCQDSQKNKTKKRGYLYPGKDSYNYFCHNCGASMSFSKLLKQLDPILYKTYIREKFSYDNEHRWHAKNAEQREERVVAAFKKQKKRPIALDTLKSVAELKNDHPCKKYVRNRKIPMKHWGDLFYVDNYQTWINKFVEPSKFNHPAKTDPRLVIPFTSENNEVFAYQGRYIGTNPHTLRYITINPKDELLVYGMNKIDRDQRVWAFEGPIDSGYIPNSIAVAGSALAKLLNTDLKPVYVFDNEPRSLEICNIMEKTIAAGAEIVVWPNDITEKDVGQMIENGMSPKKVLDILQESIYTDLDAKLKFNEWKKV